MNNFFSSSSFEKFEKTVGHQNLTFLSPLKFSEAAAAVTEALFSSLAAEFYLNLRPLLEVGRTYSLGIPA